MCNLTRVTSVTGIIREILKQINVCRVQERLRYEKIIQRFVKNIQLLKIDMICSVRTCFAASLTLWYFCEGLAEEVSFLGRLEGKSMWLRGRGITKLLVDGGCAINVGEALSSTYPWRPRQKIVQKDTSPDTSRTRQRHVVDMSWTSRLFTF